MKNLPLKTRRGMAPRTIGVILGLWIPLLFLLSSACGRESPRFYSLADEAVVSGDAFTDALAAHRFIPRKRRRSA